VCRGPTAVVLNEHTCSFSTKIDDLVDGYRMQALLALLYYRLPAGARDRTNVKVKLPRTTNTLTTLFPVSDVTVGSLAI
jgi:hypothetical protein